MAISRDTKKRQLKSRMVQGGADRYFDDDYYESDDAEKKWRKKQKSRRVIIICIIVAIILAAAAAFLIHRYYKFSGYELVSDKNLNEGSLVGYERFGENIIKYSHDGASYYNASGEAQWVDSYEMRNPVLYVSGDFACIADVSGNEINIYNVTTGLMGTAHSILPITKAVVSESGTVAAVVEDDGASYISFFRKDGTDLDISIKTTMGGDGYPLDIALSPDGTQLLAAFSYIAGGQLKSRAVFYDFSEIGKNIPNRLVGAFEEPFEDSLIARVRFINSTYSYALTDNGIYFFSSRNLSSPELVKTVLIEDEIEQVFYSAGHVGLITENLDGEFDSRLILFKPDGEEQFRYEYSGRYMFAGCDDKNIYLTGEDCCSIINMQGRVKYEGNMDELAGVVVTGHLPGRFVFSGSSFIREYQFK